MGEHMTDYDLWGPWTGNAVHVPPSPRRRSWLWPGFVVVAITVMVVAGAAAAGDDPGHSSTAPHSTRRWTPTRSNGCWPRRARSGWMMPRRLISAPGADEAQASGHRPQGPHRHPRKGQGKDRRQIIQSTPYALWEDIDAAITPILNEHGFALTFRCGSTGSPEHRVTVTGVLSHEHGPQRRIRP
jgi:hypothetical protein